MMVLVFALPGAGLRAAGVFAIVGSFATEAEFRQSFGQIMILLRGEPNASPAKNSQSWQISRFPGKKIARLTNDSKDCTELNLAESSATMTAQPPILNLND